MPGKIHFPADYMDRAYGSLNSLNIIVIANGQRPTG